MSGTSVWRGKWTQVFLDEFSITFLYVSSSDLVLKIKITKNYNFAQIQTYQKTRLQRMYLYMPSPCKVHGGEKSFSSRDLTSWFGQVLRTSAHISNFYFKADDKALRALRAKYIHTQSFSKAEKTSAHSCHLFQTGLPGISKTFFQSYKEFSPIPNLQPSRWK